MRQRIRQIGTLYIFSNSLSLIFIQADQHYQNYGHSVFGYVISTTPDSAGRSASSMWGNTDTWKLLEAELKKKNITKMVTDFETIIR